MTKPRSRVLFAGALIATAALSAPGQAQTSLDDRIRDRVPAEVRPRILAIVDSARMSGVPSEPLIQRALEGSARGVDAARIVAAVSSLYQRLKVAKEALGGEASASELSAAASALFTGVTPRAISSLKRLDPARDVALPLVVLADIIERGVPKALATDVIFSLGEAHMTDDAFRQFRETVLRDVAEGRSPAAAAEQRARALANRGRPR